MDSDVVARGVTQVSRRGCAVARHRSESDTDVQECEEDVRYVTTCVRQEDGFGKMFVVDWVEVVEVVGVEEKKAKDCAPPGFMAKRGRTLAYARQLERVSRSQPLPPSSREP